MTGFDHFDTNGVYDLRLSTGMKQTLVVTETYQDHIEGYVAETHSGTYEDPEAEFVRVDDQKVSFRTSAIIGKGFVGSFRSFERFDFPTGGPKHLIEAVPEDARDTVDYDYEDG